MWGIWILLIVGVAGIGLLMMALAVGAAPLFAILIFLLIAGAVATGFAVKRGSGYVKERDEELARDEASASPPPRPRTPDGPKPTGKPVAGEGGDVA